MTCTQALGAGESNSGEVEVYALERRGNQQKVRQNTRMNEKETVGKVKKQGVKVLKMDELKYLGSTIQSKRDGSG